MDRGGVGGVGLDGVDLPRLLPGAVHPDLVLQRVAAGGVVLDLGEQAEAGQALGCGVDLGGGLDLDAATERLSGLGLFTQVENDTTCCYALQDKVWVHGPGREPWEVYTVKADAPDATSIHPVGTTSTATGACECGSPMSKQGLADTDVAACCTTAVGA